jgi:hypothetical protein
MAVKLVRTDNKNPVIGDTVPVQVSISSIPDGVSISKAWITFKRKIEDRDIDAVLQKVITSGFTGTTTIAFTFTLTKTDTALFRPTNYVFDIQIKDSDGNIFTPFPDGEVTWQKGVTDSYT